MDLQRKLPDGWPTVRFGDVVREVRESERDPLANGIERYVGLEHLDPESLHIKRWGWIAEDEPSFTKRFRAGQLLFGRRRAYQRKAAVADFDGICSGDIVVMEAKEKHLRPELLPFIVQSEGFFSYALQTSAGSLSPRTKWSHLAKYEFALPPKDEQRRIAEILWAAEEAINKYQGMVEQLDSLRIVFFQSAVDEYRGIYHMNARVKDAITDIVAGKSPKGMSRPANPDEFGVLKVSAIGSREYLEDENKALIDPEDFQPDFQVESGFLLVTRANALKTGVGRACIVDNTRPGLMLSDKTLRLIINDRKVSKRYLLEALRSYECRQYIEMVATGTEAKNISQAKLRNAPIPLPPIEIQRKIEALLKEYDINLENALAHVDLLLDLKRNLLASVIAGETNMHYV